MGRRVEILRIRSSIKKGLANSYKSNISRSARDPHYPYHIEEMWQLFGSGFASTTVRLQSLGVSANSQKEVGFFQ